MKDGLFIALWLLSLTVISVLGVSILVYAATLIFDVIPYLAHLTSDTIRGVK